jgi:hypothetical protein
MALTKNHSPPEVQSISSYLYASGDEALSRHHRGDRATSVVSTLHLVDGVAQNW